jgi:hypothetical protein
LAVLLVLKGTSLNRIENAYHSPAVVFT